MNTWMNQMSDAWWWNEWMNWSMSESWMNAWIGWINGCNGGDLRWSMFVEGLECWESWLSGILAVGKIGRIKQFPEVDIVLRRRLNRYRQDEDGRRFWNWLTGGTQIGMPCEDGWPDCGDIAICLGGWMEEWKPEKMEQTRTYLAGVVDWSNVGKHLETGLRSHRRVVVTPKESFPNSPPG